MLEAPIVQPPSRGNQSPIPPRVVMSEVSAFI